MEWNEQRSRVFRMPRSSGHARRWVFSYSVYFSIAFMSKEKQSRPVYCNCIGFSTFVRSGPQPIKGPSYHLWSKLGQDCQRVSHVTRCTMMRRPWIRNLKRSGGRTKTTLLYISR